MKVTGVQIYGERGTGTNYLQALVESNLVGVDVRWDFGFKHFFHLPGVEAATETAFLCVYRNPFDWLRTFHNRPWHAGPEIGGLAFSDFIRAEWSSYWNQESHTPEDDPRFNTEMMFDRDPDTGLRFRNVLKMRIAKTRNWESLREKAAHQLSLRYEDMEANPQGTLDLLSARFGFVRAPGFSHIASYKGRRKKTYRKKVYDDISRADVEFIVGELDPEVERQIGYDLPALATEMLRRAPADFDAP